MEQQFFRPFQKKAWAKWKIVLVALCLTGFAFAGVCEYVGFQYNIPPKLAGKMIVRHALITGISSATAVYDPVIIKSSVMNPSDDYSKIGNSGQYIPIEQLMCNPSQSLDTCVIQVKNVKIIQSQYPFSYQPYEEPKLNELRSKYRLDELISGAKSELEAMILLRNWVRSQFKRTDYQPLMVNFDALEVLRNNIRNPEEIPHQPHQYRPCNFFPLFYSQILLSMGYQPRIVRISNPETKGYNGHGMTEVWSNQFEKWIIMDPDLNLYYERDGIPLNILDMHNARYEPPPSRIEIKRGAQTSGDMEKIRQFTVDEMINYHSYIQIIDMRNDWMTNFYFRGHPKRSDQASLVWEDDHLPKVFHLSPSTKNVSEFYWTLNQAQICVDKERENDSELQLMFKTVTPNFRNFEIEIDNSHRIKCDSAFFEWILHPGKNRLSVQPVNLFGIKGVESSVTILKQCIK